MCVYIYVEIGCCLVLRIEREKKKDHIFNRSRKATKNNLRINREREREFLSRRSFEILKDEQKKTKQSKAKQSKAKHFISRKTATAAAASLKFDQESNEQIIRKEEIKEKERRELHILIASRGRDRVGQSTCTIQLSCLSE